MMSLFKRIIGWFKHHRAVSNARSLLELVKKNALALNYVILHSQYWLFDDEFDDCKDKVNKSLYWEQKPIDEVTESIGELERLNDKLFFATREYADRIQMRRIFFGDDHNKFRYLIHLTKGQIPVDVGGGATFIHMKQKS